MKAFVKLWFLMAAFVAVSLLLVGSTQDVFAGYEEEVLADDPFAYFRLDEDPGSIEPENLGAAMDVVGEYLPDTELGVPGLIASDPGNTAARFIIVPDGDDGSGVQLEDSADINITNGPWVDKSIILWFQADDVDTVDEQVMWEQGGSTRGINMYIVEGQVFVGAWNRASDGPGAPWESEDFDDPQGNVYVGTEIESGETYMLALVQEGDDLDIEGTLTGYLNGQPFGQKTGVGQMYNHADNNGIGYVHANTYFQAQNWNNGNGRHFGGIIDEVSLYNDALSAERIAALYAAGGGEGGGAAPLEAGDANQDYEFNQLDLVQVQIAAKYLSGQAATWGEGDWDGAPGGEPGNPPAGNGFFDQLDIIAALGAGNYLKGPYAAIVKGGEQGDGQTSIIYNTGTGELGVDAPASTELTSVNIQSAGSIFTGDPADNLGGSFDNDADDNIFKATFGSSFGSLSFGNVAQAGLSEDFVANDLTVVGSLDGGGDLGTVDLVYIPEPSALVLLALGSFLLLTRRRR